MNVKGAVPTTSASTVPSTGLRTKVAMPTASTDSGEVGHYAVDGDQLAIYIADLGWMFFTGFQK